MQGRIRHQVAPAELLTDKGDSHVTTNVWNGHGTDDHFWKNPTKPHFEVLLGTTSNNLNGKIKIARRNWHEKRPNPSQCPLYHAEVM